MSKRKEGLGMRRDLGFRFSGVAVIAAAFTVIAGVSMALAGTGGKIISNPWAGLTDREKQAQVDAAHAANIKYLQDFEARHGDPRSLPVIRISIYAPPVASLGVAAAEATVIVHGRIASVHFIADPSGGMPQMNATVRMSDVGKGSAMATIAVSQLGGPVAQPNGKGALVELEDEDLMLPGDEVLLLLLPGPGGAGYVPIYGGGVQKIVGGKLAGPAAARYGVEGKTYQAMWSSFTDPTLPAGAFPLQSKSD